MLSPLLLAEDGAIGSELANSRAEAARPDGEWMADKLDPKSSSPRSAAGDPRHLLLMDDERAILVPTATYFRNLGFEVDLAQEPEEALALIQHRRYDLAVLDLHVTPYGGAEGLEVLREIRRRDHGTKVILLSAYISPEVEGEARVLGGDAVLQKPQPLPDLAQIVFALLGASRG